MNASSPWLASRLCALGAAARLRRWAPIWLRVSRRAWYSPEGRGARSYAHAPPFRRPPPVARQRPGYGPPIRLPTLSLVARKPPGTASRRLPIPARVASTTPGTPRSLPRGRCRPWCRLPGSTGRGESRTDLPDSSSKSRSPAVDNGGNVRSRTRGPRWVPATSIRPRRRSPVLIATWDLCWSRRPTEAGVEHSVQIPQLYPLCSATDSFTKPFIVGTTTALVPGVTPSDCRLCRLPARGLNDGFHFTWGPRGGVHTGLD